MKARPRVFKRRTFRRIRPQSPQIATGDHHNVYVVLLAPAAARIRKVMRENPARDQKKPIVYVGLTGLTPEERFANHKQGIKSSSFVRRFGIRLLPELYEHLNPMPYEAAAQMEKDLTEDLRQAGYTVVGGH
jgi:predicted GIY-YIG superfamily endonuclease